MCNCVCCQNAHASLSIASRRAAADLAEIQRLDKCLAEARQERDEARAVSGITAWAGDVRLAAKFARALPREDEIDSVMSLLNWTRQHHDKDSAARQWLERVVAAAVTTPRSEVG